MARFKGFHPCKLLHKGLTVQSSNNADVIQNEVELVIWGVNLC